MGLVADVHSEKRKRFNPQGPTRTRTDDSEEETSPKRVVTDVVENADDEVRGDLVIDEALDEVCIADGYSAMRIVDEPPLV